MLIYIYKFKYYRAIKSGFLIDYFIKKLIVTFSIRWIIIFNYFFNDKYLIEYFTKNFYKIYLNTLFILQNLQKINGIYIINLAIITIILINVLILLWLW